MNGPEISPARAKAQREKAVLFSDEALEHELDFAERCYDVGSPILVSWRTVLRAEYARRMSDNGAVGANVPECGSCGGMIGPSFSFPWHYADEDCRAVRQPIPTDTTLGELEQAMLRETFGTPAYERASKALADAERRTDERDFEVRLEYANGSKRTVHVNATNGEEAETLAIKDEPAGTIPHAYTAQEIS